MTVQWGNSGFPVFPVPGLPGLLGDEEAPGARACGQLPVECGLVGPADAATRGVRAQLAEMLGHISEMES